MSLQKWIKSGQWDRVSREPLSEKLMRKYQCNLNWKILCEVQTMRISFIGEMKKYVDWSIVCKKQRLDEGFLRQFSNYIDWDAISRYQVLTEEFMRKYLDRLNWKYISEYQKLSEKFIRDFSTRLDIRTMCRTQALSEEFIQDVVDNKTKTDFEFLFKRVFSEKMCEENVEDWEIRFKELLKAEVVDKFIRQEDPLDWDAIFEYQVLSDEFKDNYLN